MQLFCLKTLFSCRMVRNISKPKVIIYRFLGVLITKGRIKDDFIQITTENLLPFLKRFWNEPELTHLIDRVREESYEDRDINPSNPVVFKEIQNPKAIMDSLAFYINTKCKKDGKPQIGSAKKPHNHLIRLVVQYSLMIQRGTITLHKEKADALLNRNRMNIQQMILSSITSNKPQESPHLMAFTSSGDLTSLIDCFVNTENYSLENSSAYERMINMNNAKPEEILFMSADIEECRAAQGAGLRVIKIKVPDEIKTREFLRVRDMCEINFISNIETLNQSNEKGQKTKNPPKKANLTKRTHLKAKSSTCSNDKSSNKANSKDQIKRTNSKRQ